MPTTKPRVQVTFEEHTHDVISKFAQIQGKTRGGVIADFINSIVPSLEKVISSFDATKQATFEAQNDLLKRSDSFCHYISKIYQSDSNSSKSQKSLKAPRHGAYKKKNRR